MSRSLAYHVQCDVALANRSAFVTCWCHYVTEVKKGVQWSPHKPMSTTAKGKPKTAFKGSHTNSDNSECMPNLFVMTQACIKGLS